MKSHNLLKHSVTPSLEVHENPQTGYKSLYATKSFSADSLLSKFSFREKQNVPTQHSIQIGEEEHITLQPDYLQYTNHSCEPNVFFDTQRMEIQVLKDIEAGEEIRFFYPSTEWKMAESFECSCGSEQCLQRIQGAAYLTPSQLEKYRISDYILNLL